MKKNIKWSQIITTLLGIFIPAVILIIFSKLKLDEVFNSWRTTNVKPDWRYSLLVLLKLTVYILPPFIGMFGFYKSNNDNVTKHRFWYYFIKALNVHFLALLSIKFFLDSVLEIDKIFNKDLFPSAKDVQVLTGYIVTLLLKKNIKIEPGVDAPKELSTNTNAEIVTPTTIE